MRLERYSDDILWDTQSRRVEGKNTSNIYDVLENQRMCSSPRVPWILLKTNQLSWEPTKDQRCFLN